MAWLSQEIAENAVATVIDFASIILAYNLGLLQFSIAAGVAYAAFDAYIVIWMRRRITRWVKSFMGFLNPQEHLGIAESHKGTS